MYYFRFDGSILDFTKGPLTDRILKMANNCFVRERKDRVTLFRLKLSMVCPGSFAENRPMDFHMIMNRKKSALTCDRCNFALLGGGRLCTVNSFLLPRIFHHKKANFETVMAFLKSSGYLQLPVPDPLTWSYITFRY